MIQTSLDGIYSILSTLMGLLPYLALGLGSTMLITGAVASLLLVFSRRPGDTMAHYFGGRISILSLAYLIGLILVVASCFSLGF
jgi:hypothetical protein